MSSSREKEEASGRLIVKKREVVDQSAWPDLPSELLERIMELLSVPLDRAAARLVCASWRAFLRESFPPSDEPAFEVPRLLIRRPAGNGGELAFFSLHHKKFFPLEIPAFLRGAGRCCGNMGGYILMALDSERAIVALNHVSRRIGVYPQLPPVVPVKKVILSKPPGNPDGVAAVLGRTTGTIALLKKNVSSDWMTIGVKVGEEHQGFRDIAFWDGQLCALAEDGAVFAFRFDVSARTTTVSQLRDADDVPMSRRWKQFLVETGTQLLVVRKLYRSLGNGEVQWDVEVTVLKSAEDRVWERVVDIPGSALFVGSVVSKAVPVGMYPASSGLRGGAVYFAQNKVEMLTPHAICEYSLVDEQVRSVPVAGGHNADVEPVWITSCF